eukprot:evm.model.scf_1222.2 EVM.evm.TU.scf_1222.2   scf_1222:10854-22054(-)
MSRRLTASGNSGGEANMTSGWQQAEPAGQQRVGDGGQEGGTCNAGDNSPGCGPASGQLATGGAPSLRLAAGLRGGWMISDGNLPALARAGRCCSAWGSPWPGAALVRRVAAPTKSSRQTRAKITQFRCMMRQFQGRFTASPPPAYRSTGRHRGQDTEFACPWPRDPALAVWDQAASGARAQMLSPVTPAARPRAPCAHPWRRPSPAIVSTVLLLLAAIPAAQASTPPRQLDIWAARGLARSLSQPEHGSPGASGELFLHRTRRLLQDNTGEDLLAAASEGDVAEVSRLLAAGVDVDSTDSRGNTPLVLAAASGHVSVLRVLLEAGADINKQGQRGLTALNAAASEGQSTAVRFLLQGGADTELRDDEGRTPLIVAIFNNGNLAMVTAMLEAGAEVDGRGPGRDTPLMSAANLGLELIVKVLLENGADVSLVDSTGTGPVHDAAVGGSTEALQLVLDAGGDIDAQNSLELTPVMLAALFGRADALRLLIDQGADIVSPTRFGTALHMGARFPNNVIVLRIVLEAGVDIDERDNSGITAINQAARLGNIINTKFLLEEGASPALNGVPICGCLDAEPEPNCPAGNCERKEDLDELNELFEVDPEKLSLHDAVTAGNLEVVEAKIADGADVNELDFDGDTPLHLAATRGGGHLEVVQVLLDNTADVTVVDDFRQTALHFAAETSGTEEIMQLLLDAGTDVNALAQGSPPVEYASWSGNADGVRFLLSKGADPLLGDGDGFRDEPCGCLENVGDTDLRQCAEGACETPGQIAEIEGLMGRNEAPATSAGGTPEPVEETVECGSLPTVLQRLECTAGLAR